MDRTASRIFNRCINRLKSRDWLAPEVVRFHARPHIETLRKRREAIIRELGTPGEQHHEKAQFEETLFRRLSREVTQCVAKEQLPRYREEAVLLQMVLERMELLRRHIEDCFPAIRRFYGRNRRYQRWKGCKVIVTADRNVRQSDTLDLSGGRRLMVFSDGRGDADFVVVTDNPRPLVWLMHRLYHQEGEGFIDFQNKFEFFARIAIAAREFLAENSGDSEAEEQRLLLHCLREPIDMVTEYRDAVQQRLHAFEAYCRAQENL